ncbi:hypothetical protein VN97_g7625, partial [Penicillium thymicola]
DFKDLCGGNSFNITREASIRELQLQCTVRAVPKGGI